MTRGTGRTVPFLWGGTSEKRPRGFQPRGRSASADQGEEVGCPAFSARRRRPPFHPRAEDPGAGDWINRRKKRLHPDIWMEPQRFADAELTA